MDDGKRMGSGLARAIRETHVKAAQPALSVTGPGHSGDIKYPKLKVPWSTSSVNEMLLVASRPYRLFE